MWSGILTCSSSPDSILGGSLIEMRVIFSCDQEYRDERLSLCTQRAQSLVGKTHTWRGYKTVWNYRSEKVERCQGGPHHLGGSWEGAGRVLRDCLEGTCEPGAGNAKEGVTLGCRSPVVLAGFYPNCSSKWQGQMPCRR